MIKFLTHALSISLIVLSTNTWAQPLMNKIQFSDYSVLYQCADIKYSGDMEKKEAELIRIEERFGLNDDNFDAFDELITEYERDDTLLDNIRLRVSKEC